MDDMKILKIVIISIAIINACYFTALIFMPETEQTIEIGQTWIGIDSIDPFKEIEYDTVVVIDIKNDYAKVIINGDTTSMPISIVNWKRSILE